jgi:flagellar basal body-associated protein FliL
MDEDNNQTALWILVGVVIAIFLLGVFVFGVWLYNKSRSAPFLKYEEGTNRPSIRIESEDKEIPVSKEQLRIWRQQARVGSQSGSGDARVTW